MYIQTDSTTFSFSVAEEIEYDDPKSYREFLERNDGDLWLEAMNDVLRSLEKNKTWILVNKAKNKKIVGCKWIFRKKKPRYKARLVAKGFTQRKWIDLYEIFSLFSNTAI